MQNLQKSSYKDNKKKKGKENYYKQYFKDNKNNLINVWKGIKEIMLMKKNK